MFRFPIYALRGRDHHPPSRALMIIIIVVASRKILLLLLEVPPSYILYIYVYASFHRLIFYNDEWHYSKTYVRNTFRVIYYWEKLYIKKKSLPKWSFIHIIASALRNAFSSLPLRCTATRSSLPPIQWPPMNTLGTERIPVIRSSSSWILSPSSRSSNSITIYRSDGIR